MNPMVDIYVRMIEGADYMVPVKAHDVAPRQYQIIECKEFDPEDTSLLFEYLPSDIVRLDNDKAVALISSQNIEERAYWHFLFKVVFEKDIFAPGSSFPYLSEVATRIQREIKDGTRWHYPSVKNWIAQNLKQ
jgi:hypothetical protein